MRIAIVNDLNLAVEALRRVVDSMAGHSVAWIARDGQEAVNQCLADTPDLILMDLIMPVMDGVQATAEIMSRCPCPILVVTASLGVNAGKVYEAMGHGAVDAVRTPTLGLGGRLEGAETLTNKILRVAMLTGKVTPRETRSGFAPPPAPVPTTAPEFPPLLAIGASTGGPQALATILSALPHPFPAAIALVQHVDPDFAGGLATWLSQRSHFEVHTARPGQHFQAGKVVLAATEDHLIVDAAGRLSYTPTPREAVYRPSVDVFFRSLAQHWPNPGLAVLLTGMGRDGAEGLKILRGRGWKTIAQGQQSSIVYGMPKAAALIGAAMEILELPAIAPAIAAHFQVSIGSP